MSRLSDLLNPAPTADDIAPRNTRMPNGHHGTSAHVRSPSITSPLEALAIAAITSPPAAPSSPPPPTPPAAPAQENVPPLKSPYSPQKPTPSYPFLSAPRSALSNATNMSAPSRSPPQGRLPNEEVEKGADSESGTVQSQDQAATSRAQESDCNQNKRPLQKGEHQEKEDLSDPTPISLKGEVGNFVSPPPHPTSSPTIQPTTESAESTDPAMAMSRPKAQRPVMPPKKKRAADPVRKSPMKKRRTVKEGTPASLRRSFSPASSRASKTPMPHVGKADSVAISLEGSPPPTEAGDEEYEDENDIFCICRKPDDHTFMIGCDGGCEDWFHGHCVKIDEKDGELVAQYICPNCHAKGRGQTTWKPQCRLDGCHKPARVDGPKPSKYCSDEHGTEFMTRKSSGKGHFKKSDKSTAVKKRRKDSQTDRFGNEDDDEPEEDIPAHLRGGRVTASELKGVVDGVRSVEEFRKLGDRPDSPTAEDSKETGISYTASEREELERIAKEKASIEKKREALADKETLLQLVKARAKNVLEEVKKKESVREICGYDERLSWADEEFDQWRRSSDGRSTLDTGVLKAPILSDDTKKESDGDAGSASREHELSRGVCLKKRCERHKTWAKNVQQEIAFEKEECRVRLGKAEVEERDLKMRALLRSDEDVDGAEDVEPKPEIESGAIQAKLEEEDDLKDRDGIKQ